MDIQTFLSSATTKLIQAGIGTARLDCLVMLEDVLNTNRTQLLAHPERTITDEQLKVLNEFIDRRTLHVPLAYIRGKTEFYGRDFIINEDVLEPRPESETMIELLLQLSLKQRVKLADIGSGSGALGITAALELGLDRVWLHDIDANTLEVARQNAAKYNVAANFLVSDLIKNNNADYDILLCNLPYVPDNFQVNTAALHEPSIALFGGPDGLDLYRRLFGQINKSGHKPQYILTESLPPQHEQLATIAAQAGYHQQADEDFVQLFSF